MNEILEPLARFLDDPTITELMWNTFELGFAEREGKLVDLPRVFATKTDYERLVVGLKPFASDLNESASTFDGVLPDGSRFHVTLPPLSPFGATLTIRKFSLVHRGMAGLLTAGFFTERAMVFLEACVRARCNVLVSGATGAGKTTLLNALAGAIPASERLLTIEDVPEIQLTHKNWVRLVATRDGGKDAVRSSLIGALRMRPDRILVGECRSSEALEMLQMMNTGHDGGITTLHANSSAEAVTRLETLILFHAGAEIPLRALRRQIVDAIDLVVHVGRTPDGARQVEEITELVGMEGEVVTRTSLFKRVEQAGRRRLKSTGLVPTFMAQLQLPKNFFEHLELVPKKVG